MNLVISLPAVPGYPGYRPQLPLILVFKQYIDYPLIGTSITGINTGPFRTVYFLRPINKVNDNLIPKMDDKMSAGLKALDPR